MARIFTLFLPIVLLSCTSCIGMLVATGERVDISKDCNQAFVKYEHCENDPEKIQRYRGEPQRKYFKDNKEFWVYEKRGTRGILIGAIIPLPLYVPWTDDTTFEFENGKRVRTTMVKANGHGLLCGYLFGIEHFDWTCWTGKDWQRLVDFAVDSNLRVDSDAPRNGASPARSAAASRRQIAPGERPSLICREARQIKPARDGLDPCGVSRSAGALYAKGRFDEETAYRFGDITDGHKCICGQYDKDT